MNIDNVHTPFLYTIMNSTNNINQQLIQLKTVFNSSVWFWSICFRTTRNYYKHDWHIIISELSIILNIDIVSFYKLFLCLFIITKVCVFMFCYYSWFAVWLTGTFNQYLLSLLTFYILFNTIYVNLCLQKKRNSRHHCKHDLSW